MSRFLRFTVEHTLENRAAELKEYVIGVEVFDRTAALREDTVINALFAPPQVPPMAMFRIR